MSDRELLELAAKAIGFGGGEFVFNAPIYAGERQIQHGGLWDYVTGSPLWNPLVDDGEALRLAVKLKMSLDWFDSHGETRALCIATTQNGQSVEFYETEAEAMKSARRAIVLAAAAIGKQMTEPSK